MRITEVSNDDGKACGNLIKFLTKGRWELSADEAEILSATKKWLHSVAMQMAENLGNKQVAPPATSMRIKSAGPLIASNIKKKKSK